MKKRLVVAITGASGVIYGIRLLQACRSLNVETHLVASEWGKKNIELETDFTVEQVTGLSSRCYGEGDLAAPVASGSYRHDGMVIIPCSMKTLGSLAAGITANLVVRAADVTLKEGRRLIVVPREAPFHVIHLENMLKLAGMGAVIYPPVPSMYARPQTVEELIDNTVGRILERLEIPNGYYCRWGEPGCQT